MSEINSPYYLSSIPNEDDESFMNDFETIVLKSRQNIIVNYPTNIKNYITKKYGQIYNYIYILLR